MTQNQRTVRAGSISFSNAAPLVAIGGTCSIESEELTLKVAGELKSIFKRLDIPFVFKASFDKANRSSIRSWRGLGMKRGLEILSKVKKNLGLPVVTDIHEAAQAAPTAKVADILQIPAFLCRQTDLLTAAAKTKKPVNVKKGQFLSPWECKNIVEKLEAGGNKQVMLTERGFMFGYNNLVVDMRSLEIMKETGCPVLYDATHSLQLPGGAGDRTGGLAHLVYPLARAAAAVGVAAIFFETHPEPSKAKSDGPNSLRLAEVEKIFSVVSAIDRILKRN